MDTLSDYMDPNVFNCPADHIDGITVQRPGIFGGGQSYHMWAPDWDIERRVYATEDGFWLFAGDNDTTVSTSDEELGPFLSLDECMDAYITFRLEGK